MNTSVIPFIMGILFLIIGYVLKNNLNIFLMSNSSHSKDVVLMETADKSGNILMLFGLILLLSAVCMFFLGFRQGYILLSLMLVILTVFSLSLTKYRISRKYRIKTKAVIVLGMAIFFLVAIPTSLFFILSEPRIQIKDNEIVMESVYNYKIPRETIEDVELINYMPSRPLVDEGFELLGVSRGKFNCEKWNSVHMLLETSRSPYIHIRTGDGNHYLFNFSKSEKTIEHYNTILEKYKDS